MNKYQLKEYIRLLKERRIKEINRILFKRRQHGEV